MAANDTTTIRVSVQTRDRLRTLAEERGETSGDTVSRLVASAAEDDLIKRAMQDFERMSKEGRTDLYRAESEKIGHGFDSATPDW